MKKNDSLRVSLNNSDLKFQVSIFKIELATTLDVTVINST